MPGLYPTAYRATFPAFFMRLPLVCFYCLVCILFVFSILSRRCHLLATFLSVLLCLLSLLISDFRFDLVWFRLSCDHGWIRSGSVNVRKTTTNPREVFSTLQYFVSVPRLSGRGGGSATIEVRSRTRRRNFLGNGQRERGPRPPQEGTVWGFRGAENEFRTAPRYQ